MVRFNELMTDVQELADVGIQCISEWREEQLAKGDPDPTVADEHDKMCLDLLEEIAQYILESVQEQAYVSPDDE